MNELNEKLAARIKNIQDSNIVYSYFKNLELTQFSVGDYLVKRSRFGDKFQTETISSISKIPKKFKCIHVDEYGIRYIQAIGADGKDLPYIEALTNCTSEYSHFIIDPDYADHIILNADETFDPSSDKKKEKKERDAVTRANKKIAKFIKNPQEAEAFFMTLKPGDKIRWGRCIPDAASSMAHEVEKVEVNIDPINRQKRIVVTLANNNYRLISNTVYSEIFFTQEPYPYASNQD